jgi:hypothetical protein
MNASTFVRKFSLAISNGFFSALLLTKEYSPAMAPQADVDPNRID